MILWVDDDTVASLRPYIDELTDAGYHVEIARDPDVMWHKLAIHSDKINCIIMDILLPTGNSVDRKEADSGYLTGLVLLEYLKNNNKLNKIPILILTIGNDAKVMSWAKKYNIPFCSKQIMSSLDLLNKIKKMHVKPM